MFRISAVLVAVLLAGCRDPAAGHGKAPFEALPFFQMTTQTRGCPVVGELFSVRIRMNADSTATLSGTWIVPGNPDEDECFEPHLPAFGCVVEVALPEGRLEASEIRQLRSLFSAIPREVFEVNPTCDPCSLVRHVLDGRMVAGISVMSGCETVSQQYVDAVRRFETFLKQTALQGVE